jgi:CubicO group peptidase (beta-lactamase class C family)
MRNIDPVTPGELLREEFLEPMGLSQTADTDLRLCRALYHVMFRGNQGRTCHPHGNI